MKSYRLQQIEEFVNENETVSMYELCEKMHISMNTARNDVSALVNEGKIIKVYGGIKTNKKSTLVPFEDRLSKNKNEKMLIASRAADYVENGSVIYLDSGTTSVCMVKLLANKQQLTIITNSLSVLNAAIPYPNLTVITLPGKLEANTYSFVSADTVAMLQKYNISSCFMAATGVSELGTVTNSSLLEYEIKKAVMEKAIKKYLLIDNTKYNKVALMTYANIDDFTGVITNKSKTGDIAALCKKMEVDCDVVDNSGDINKSLKME